MWWTQSFIMMNYQVIYVMLLVHVINAEKVSDVTKSVDVLAEGVTALEKILDDLSEFEHKTSLEFRVLTQDLAVHEGSDCANPFLELQCRDSKVCLPQYLVCDGREDCPRGEDEQDCEIDDYMSAGEIFEASLVFNKCLKTTITKYIIKIEAIKQDELFPNMPKYVVSYMNIYGDRTDLWYNPFIEETWLPAARTGSTFWLETDYQRKFDLVDHDIIFDFGFFPGTREVCTLWVLKRRRSDEPFPWAGYYD